MSAVSGDSKTIANLLQFKNINEVGDEKLAKLNEKLAELVGDGKFDSKEYESLKETFLGLKEGLTETDFVNEVSKVIGKTAANKLNGSQSEIKEPSKNDKNDIKVPKESKHEVVIIDLHSLGDDAVAIDADNDITNNKEHHIVMKDSEGSKFIPEEINVPEVNVANKNGRYNYGSDQAKSFEKSIKSISNGKKTLNPKPEFYDGASIDKVISEMKLTEEPVGKLKSYGSKDVQDLQSYVGLPESRQDGVFGAETMSNLKNIYAQAIKDGDANKVEKLSGLMFGLSARLNDGSVNDKTLEALVDAGDKLLGNIKGKNSSETAAKDNKIQKEQILIQANNITENISKGLNSGDIDLDTDIPALVEQKTKDLNIKVDGKTHNIKIPDNIKAEIVENLEAEVASINEANAAQALKEKQAEEAPHVDALSDHVQKQPKELVGDDHVQALGNKETTPRGKVVEKAFRALYKQEGSGDDASFKLNGKRKQVEENLTNLLNSSEANDLNGKEINSLIKKFDKVGANDKDIAKVVLNIDDNSKAAEVIQNSGKSGQVRDIIKESISQNPDKAGEILSTIDSKELATIIQGYGRDKNAGAVLNNLEPKKAAAVLNNMKSGKAEDVFEEMASKDPKHWGEILGELEKIEPKKASTFFNEIDRGDGMNSKTVKAQVMINKHLSNQPDKLSGDKFLKQLRKDGSESSVALVDKFHETYQSNGSKDGKTLWVKKSIENKPEKSAEEILENIPPFEDEGFSKKSQESSKNEKVSEVKTESKTNNKTTEDLAQEMVKLLDSNEGSLDKKVLSALSDFKAKWPQVTGEKIDVAPAHNIPITLGIDDIAEALGIDIELPKISNILSGNYDFDKFSTQLTDDPVKEMFLKLLEEIALKEMEQEKKNLEE